MKRSEFEKLIKEAIREELKADEHSHTGMAAPLTVPTAFEKKKKRGRKMRENSYKQYKGSDGSARQKIGKALSELNKQLMVLEHMLSMNTRLKKESSEEMLWKRSYAGLTKMEGRLMRMASMIRELKS